MKVGIIQGRLTTPAEGHQTTPMTWRLEFKALKELGLTHIEWNLDSSKLYSNPLFSERIDSEITDAISSVCFDNLVTKHAYEESYFKTQFVDLVCKLSDLKIKSVTMPLLEASCIDSEARLSKLKNLLDPVLEAHEDVIFNIETDSKIDLTRSLLDHANNIRFTYDTGNITASGFDHRKYIEATFDKIDNVHLKDRYTNNGPSAPDFLGDTDFEEIFHILSKNRYDNIFTLQMARGISGKEYELTRFYLETFRKKYEQHF